ncbi:hypothetical protein [Archangium lipolyticum]|uniref:hypothetical protein n=1 Tax=Archangium lipolyticum TaxID=2970465 RepID=UPI00214A321B|nr:hypothetical protein [Archangium lipolyticum]
MKTNLWKPLMLLAALFLAHPAAAERPAECQKRCQKDTKVCEDICKKHAGSGADKCTKACKDEEKVCTEECKK